MSKHRISLTVEGVDPPHKLVRVDDFLRELRLLLSSLREVEFQTRYPSGGSLYYNIVELSYGSPATVVIEPLPADPVIDISSDVVSTFTSIVDSINLGKPLQKKVTHSLLEKLSAMVSPVGKTLSLVQLSTPTATFPLTRDFAHHAEELLRPEESWPGFMRGMLEAINVHKGANLFRIYPDIGPSKITCHFPEELQAIAIQSIGRFVEVKGTLKYKSAALYPHEVQVSNLQALPDEEELPTLTDLQGIAPNATGSQLSEDFVRELRNAAD